MNQVQFQQPYDDLQPPAPGYVIPFSGLQGHLWISSLTLNSHAAIYIIKNKEDILRGKKKEEKEEEKERKRGKRGKKRKGEKERERTRGRRWRRERIIAGWFTWA